MLRNCSFTNRSLTAVGDDLPIPAKVHPLLEIALEARNELGRALALLRLPFPEFHLTFFGKVVYVQDRLLQLRVLIRCLVRQP